MRPCSRHRRWFVDPDRGAGRRPCLGEKEGGEGRTNQREAMFEIQALVSGARVAGQGVDHALGKRARKVGRKFRKRQLEYFCSPGNEASLGGGRGRSGLMRAREPPLPSPHPPGSARPSTARQAVSLRR